jgi:GMP synthase (glutamine-hydrolysing)
MASRTCLAVRHVNFEGLGVLGMLLRERGYHTHYVDAHDPSLTVEHCLAAKLVVVLGGPHAVYEADKHPFIRHEINCAHARLQADKPILGICLGAQIMTVAMGGKVAASASREFGWGEVKLTPEGTTSVLAALQDVPILHWHGDNCALAPGCTLLASNKFSPVQAFQVKPHQLGLQFHLETGPERIDHWLDVYKSDLMQFKISAGDIRAQAKKFGEAAVEAGRKVFSNWLDQIEAPP